LVFCYVGLRMLLNILLLVVLVKLTQVSFTHSQLHTQFHSDFEEIDGKIFFFQKCVKQLRSRSPRSGKCLTSLWKFSKLPENYSCQAPPKKEQSG